ncbi:MAG: MAPEG family protein [Sphingomonadales bacterium]|nr:MAPEG family protein [Sphingomonadales bacterium]MDE2569654.1 MAPEG family protein [Sphingomonadales bacterium]
MTLILPVTLSAAAAAAVINIWLATRCGQVRSAEKISIGDGGNDLLARRMRAQLNFAENTPLVLVLIAAIELARPGSMVLAIIAGIYALGRVAHGIGMDGKGFAAGRSIGIVITMLTELGLAGWGIVIAMGW